MLTFSKSFNRGTRNETTSYLDDFFFLALFFLVLDLDRFLFRDLERFRVLERDRDFLLDLLLSGDLERLLGRTLGDLCLVFDRDRDLGMTLVDFTTMSLSFDLDRECLRDRLYLTGDFERLRHFLTGDTLKTITILSE